MKKKRDLPPAGFLDDLHKLVRKADIALDNNKTKQDPWTFINTILKELYEAKATKNFIYLAWIIIIADQDKRPYPAWASKALAEGCRQYLSKRNTSLDKVFNANKGFERMIKAGRNFEMMSLIHEATTCGSTVKHAAPLVLEKFRSEGKTAIEEPDTLRQMYERGWYKKFNTPSSKVRERQRLIMSERLDLLKYLPNTDNE